MERDGVVRKRIKHYHEPGDLHELTFSCYRQHPLLTNDDWRCRLARSLDHACVEERFELAAFVYMPDHVHLIVTPLEAEPDIDRFLARIKRPVAGEVREILERRPTPLLKKLTVVERPGKTCFRFWQEGPGFDRNLYSREAIQNALDYIHNNPVRRGLCERAVDWPWSSARYYLLEPPRQQFEGLPHVHGLPPGVFS
jgi:putative transposase